MTQECRHSKDPADCYKCTAVARELLAKADLTTDEREKVGKLLAKMKHKESLDDESRTLLDELAARYLE